MVKTSRLIVYRINSMPAVNINYLAVIVAAIANMVLGYLWYGPVFGKQWIALMGMTSADMEAAKAKGMGKSYVLTFVGALLMSYILAHSLIFAGAYFHASGVAAGLMSGFWSWVGFILPALLGMMLWAGKPWKLYVLNVGYFLVALLVMGAILGMWK